MGSLTIIITILVLILILILILILTLKYLTTNRKPSFFSFFLFPSSFFLLLFFHLGELGQPNHVQFRVTVTVMTVIFYFFSIFPVVVQGSGKKKSFMGGNKKKVKFSSNFPLSSSITYTRVELSTEGKKKYCGRDNRSFLGWW